jgi:hypothetical protein
MPSSPNETGREDNRMDDVDMVRVTAIFSTAIYPPLTGCPAGMPGRAEGSTAERVLDS